MGTHHRSIWTLVFLAVLGMGTMSASPLVSSEMAQTDERFEKLSADQKKLAQRMLQFMSDMDKKYFAQVNKLNNNSESETKEFTSDDSDYVIKVTRGAVVEKMGQMIAVGKKAMPNSRIPGNLIWGRFYSLDAHPKSPLVGMLHATIVLQFYDSGMSFAGGWVDIMPGTRIEADLNELKQSVDKVFAKYNLNPDYNRKLICKGDPTEIDRKWRRKPSCGGASFYGRPPFPSTEKNFDLVSETFVNFVDAYMGLVEKHKDSPYTEKDVKAQDTMRREWLQDQLFSDPHASKIVPFEAWSLANVPPVIKF